MRSVFILNNLKRTSTPIINDKEKNHTHMLFKICHIEHSNNFGILEHNLDIPFFFATTEIRYFLGYLVDLGYAGYPNFFLPQRQYYHILVFWDIPILIRHI